MQKKRSLTDLLCLCNISGSLDISVICCRNSRGFKRPSTQEDLHLRVIKRLPTVLITKAKTVFSEHAKSYHHGRAPNVDTSTKEHEGNMHCQNKTSKVCELGSVSERHARK